MALLDLLKFVTNGVWGTGKGSVLTAVEADTNIYSLADAIQDLIDNPIEGVGITNIVVTGSSVVFYLSDGSTHGPFALPIAYPRNRGDWLPSTSYVSMDIVKSAVYGTYLVLQDHVSAATFDPNASNVNGALYSQIAPSASAAALEITAATLTLDLTHAGRYLRFTNGSGCAVTLNSGIFSDHTEIHFRQSSSTPVTVSAGAGVTINKPTGYASATFLNGDVMTLKNVGGNVWDAFGNLASA